MLLTALFSCALFYSYLSYSFVSAFNPQLHQSCSSCKWFVPHEKGNEDYGLCSFYKTKYNLQGRETVICEFASHCRKNEAMCGEKGYMYEPIAIGDAPSSSEYRHELKEKYDELSSCCCGEVNQVDEIEKLEKEMFEIMQKIKKHNTRTIYKTTKDLYKLFKRK